jgi:NADPH-dependent 2,4-dienoyl-CoA reductase/sulfur reductase-like enzyme
MNQPEIVIVGTGMAGLRAAERLRERGFGGFVTMVGDELGEPYNRPPLSKQMLTGKMREPELAFQTFTHLAVELRAGQRATRLDPHRQLVMLDSGEDLYYDGLIVATGVAARQVPEAPQHDERITTLRTIGDFRLLDQHLRGARRVAIIGGGFIGCEVAASARHRSLQVTLVDRAPVLLNRVLGPQLGVALSDIHRRAGIDVRSGTSVERWSTSRAGVRLDLSDNTSVLADVVLVAVGTIPCVDWLAGSGADISDGVLCDETCHVVGLDNVVAAGDVARWPNLRFDHTPRRVEHWINAVEQAQAAADNLLDGRRNARPFLPVPRFWSEQHGVKIQSVGMPSLADRMTLIEGDLRGQAFTAAFLRGKRMVGAIGFNSARTILDCAPVVEAANTSPIAEPQHRLKAVGAARGQSVLQTNRLPATPLPHASRSTLVSYGFAAPAAAHSPSGGSEPLSIPPGGVGELPAHLEQNRYRRDVSAG